MVDHLETFGANLRKLRRKRGLSQEKLALLSDVHRTHISKIERSLTEPGIRTVIKLMIHLDAGGGPLFEGIDKLGEPPAETSS